MSSLISLEKVQFQIDWLVRVGVSTRENYKTGFAVPVKMPTLATMENTEQVFEEARRAGIDLDLVDINLSLSVSERWSEHNGALELMLKLEQARKNRDAKLQSTVATSQ